MAVFFTSDQHFGHANIIAYCGRPFRNVEEMNREIVARHNARVSPDDVVYHLGDFSLQERLVPQILPLLNGRKTLVMGNHDKCFKDKKAVSRYLHYGFEHVCVELVYPPLDAKLCHMPYAFDGEADRRYFDKRPKDDGGWLLHGHVHERWKTKGRMINVGVDQWSFAPASEEELRGMMERA
jgi:calcineurin-like phosphoesterase family protein